MELYNHILTALDQIQDEISNQKLREAWGEEFESLLSDAKENSRILVMGEFNAGKSTFLNALLGKKWLATDVTPATAMITVLKYGENPSLEMVKKDGSQQQLNFELLHAISAEGDPEVAKLRAEADHLIVSIPSELLKTINFGRYSGTELNTYTSYLKRRRLFSSKQMMSFGFSDTGLLVECRKFRVLSK